MMNARGTSKSATSCDVEASEAEIKSTGKGNIPAGGVGLSRIVKVEPEAQ